MGTLVVLFEESHHDPVFDMRTREKLACLGITSVSLLRDQRMLGIVLDGWAFDPSSSADEARTAVAGTDCAVRVLRPVQTAVTHASRQGGNQ